MKVRTLINIAAAAGLLLTSAACAVYEPGYGPGYYGHYRGHHEWREHEWREHHWRDRY